MGNDGGLAGGGRISTTWGMNELLSVVLGRVRNANNPSEIFGPKAWRVRVHLTPELAMKNGVLTAVIERPAFARKKDAEIGRNALLAAGLDTIEKLQANRDELERIMIEALPW